MIIFISRYYKLTSYEILSVMYSIKYFNNTKRFRLIISEFTF